MPGTKLAEQKIADIFQVSRTLVRQALNQLSRDKLVTLEPARGARVAEPGVDEARQVFEGARMLEAAMVSRAASRSRRRRSASCAPTCRPSTRRPRTDVSGRTRLLADFHVVHRAPCSATRCWRDARRSGLALVADRADVPVGAFGRAFVRRARGDRRRAGAARRARRGQADGSHCGAWNATCISTRASPTWRRCCKPTAHEIRMP